MDKWILKSTRISVVSGNRGQLSWLSNLKTDCKAVVYINEHKIEMREKAGKERTNKVELFWCDKTGGLGATRSGDVRLPGVRARVWLTSGRRGHPAAVPFPLWHRQLSAKNLSLDPLTHAFITLHIQRFIPIQTRFFFYFFVIFFFFVIYQQIKVQLFFFLLIQLRPPSIVVHFIGQTKHLKK